MKSTSELTDYYYNELYSSIKELEVKRKEIVSRLEAYGFAGLVLFIILALIIARNFGIAHYSFIILLISAGGIYGVLMKIYYIIKIR
jgi:uncharacterized membrane protein